MVGHDLESATTHPTRPGIRGYVTIRAHAPRSRPQPDRARVSARSSAGRRTATTATDDDAADVAVCVSLGSFVGPGVQPRARC